MVKKKAKKEKSWVTDKGRVVFFCQFLLFPILVGVGIYYIMNGLAREVGWNMFFLVNLINLVLALGCAIASSAFFILDMVKIVSLEDGKNGK